MSYPPPPTPPGEPDPASSGGYPPPPAYPPPASPPPGHPADPATPGAYPPPPGYGAQPGAYPPPGGYPPPGYGPPPGYPPYPMPPVKRRRRWPWIVGGIVLALVVVLVVIGVVFGKKGSDDPHTAVDRFWHAVQQHDRSKAENYLCPGRKLAASFDQAIDSVQSYQIGPESGSGSTRVYPVTVHLVTNGIPVDDVVDTTAKKSTGKWYVCQVAPR